MSNKIKCPMCSGKKVFHIRTFSYTPRGSIIPHVVEKPCPICKGQGFLVSKLSLIKP